jgi:hypothetical protein
MDVLKIFPSLLLDLISKVVPGFFFLLVFQNRYLPPSDLLLKLFEPQALPDDWLTWYRMAMIVVTSYFIGVVIAIFGNLVEEQLIRRHWHARFKRNLGAYLSAGDQRDDIRESLASSTAFVQFIDHCRDFICASSTATAALLEKYRTAYRLFFGLTLLLFVLPFGQRTLQSALSFLAVPVLGSAAYYMSRRYLCKSLQLYAIAKSTQKGDGEDLAKATSAVG